MAKKILCFVVYLLIFNCCIYAIGDEGISIPGKSLFFRVNNGQWIDGSSFHCTNDDENISYFNNHLVFSQRKAVNPYIPKVGDPPHYLHPPKFEFSAWEVHFEGANPNPRIYGEGKSEAFSNYFTKEKGEESYIGVADFEGLTMKNIYPGISFNYFIDQPNLKYNILLEPGADLSVIKMRYSGDVSLKINEAGDLVIKTPWKTYRESIPLSYQNNIANRQVKIIYRLINDSTVGFESLSELNPNESVTIDPIYLDWSTYFYGNKTNNSTWVYDVEIDKNDFVYVTGYTSDIFPGTKGIYDTSFNGGSADAFICKLPLAGKTLEYFCYIGGTGYDYAYGIATTDDGRCYITGLTQSTNFPTTLGAYQTTFTFSTYNSYITGLYPDGKSLIYSTYMSNGTLGTWSFAIDVNERGEVFTAPYTYGSFPVTHKLLPPGFVTAPPDCYIIKFNASGSAIKQSTLFGGDGFEYTMSIFVDKRDNVYLGGYTNSQNLPVIAGYKNFGGSFGAPYDGFLFKIDSAFKKYLISKYITASDPSFEYITAITVNDASEIFIGGLTSGYDLPAKTNNSFGGYNYFVMKMRADGAYPYWSTFIGNSFWSYRQRIAASAQDELILTGNTNSLTFPVTSDAFQKTLKGPYDAFIAKLDFTGNIKYATYLGGTAADYLYAAQVKRIGCVTHIVMGGYSTSNNFPIKNAWKATNNNATSYAGVLCKWRDTLKVVKPDLGPDKYQCSKVYWYMETENRGATYRWSNGDTTRGTNIKKPGEVWLKVTYGCGWEADTVNFFLNAFPLAQLRGDTVLCNNDSLQLNAYNDTIPNVSYYWNTGDTSKIIMAKKQGKYIVTVNTKRCGSIVDSMYIKHYVDPKVSLGFDTVLCLPNQLSLDAGNDTNDCKYIWNTSDTTQKVKTMMNGYYSVEIKNVCGIARDTILVNYDSFPVTRLPADTVFCNNINLTLYADPYYFLHKLKWSSSDTTYRVNITKPGKLILTKFSKCGISSDSMNIGIVYTPTADLGKDTIICSSKTITLQTAKIDSTTYYWNSDPLPGINSFVTNYSGKFNVMAKNRCGAAQDTVLVTFEEPLSLKMPKDTILCDVPDYTIIPIVTGTAGTWNWSPSGNTQTINVSNSGTFTLLAKNLCNQVSGSVNVYFGQKPSIKLPAGEMFCDVMLPRNIVPVYSGNDLNYQWNTLESTPSITVRQPGKYLCIVNNKCGEARDSNIYYIVASPVVDLGKDTSFCGPFSYDLDAGYGQNYIYTWSNGGSTDQFNKTTTYGPVSVTVTSIEGCKGSDEIVVYNSCNTRVFVPNSFSPNRDGINEFFIPIIKETSDYTLRIFNRWGKKVFETNDPKVGWDGSFDGMIQPEGVYAWYIIYEGGYYKGNMKGTLTLLR